MICPRYEGLLVTRLLCRVIGKRSRTFFKIFLKSKKIVDKIWGCGRVGETWERKMRREEMFNELKATSINLNNDRGFFMSWLCRPPQEEPSHSTSRTFLFKVLAINININIVERYKLHEALRFNPFVFSSIYHNVTCNA